MKIKCFHGALSNSRVISAVDLDCTEMTACTETPFATWRKIEMTHLQGWRKA